MAETKGNVLSEKRGEIGGLCVCGHNLSAHGGRWNEGSCRIPGCWCNQRNHRFQPKKEEKDG